MDKREKKILEVSDEILDYLLEFRKNHPDFTFALRSRNKRNHNENKFEEGRWFQGSVFIAVPLFKVDDGVNKTKTIGLKITFKENGDVSRNYIQFTVRSGILTKEQENFHKDLAEKIGLELDSNNKGFKEYPEPNKYLDNLYDYLTSFRELALKELKKYNLEKEFIVTEDEFRRRYNDVLEIKKNFKL